MYLTKRMRHALSSAIKFARSVLENPSVPLRNAIGELFGARTSEAGVNITQRTALECEAAYQCVEMISADLAKLPLDIYRNLPGGGKERDRKHSSRFLLRRKPNESMTSFHFKQTLTAHAINWGNGYAYIERDKAGRAVELLPLLPDRTHPFRAKGRLRYQTTVDGEPRFLDAVDVLHIRGMGYNGLLGFGIIPLAAQSLGLSMAAEIFGARFFGSGSTMSGLLLYPGQLSDEAVKRIERYANPQYQGLSNSHKLRVFEEGFKFEALTVPPDQAQFLQTREFQRRVIAGWYKMPPSRIGDTATRTFASIEMDDLRYLGSTMDPWCVRWEEESWDKLLTEDEKKSESHDVEFNRLALLRTDSRARSQFYHNALQDGWMNRDEVRDRENMNPLPNKEGQKYFVPLNMQTTGKDAKPQDDDKQAKSLRRLRASQRDLVTDAAARVLERIAKQARQAAQGPDKRADSRKYCAWLDTEPALREWANGQFAAVQLSLRGALGLKRSELGAELVASVVADLRSIADTATPETLLAAVERVLSDHQQQAATVARRIVPAPRRRALIAA